MRAFLLGLLLLGATRAEAVRLYWFVPDGLRADPVLDVFKWAREGRLPNIKRMMDEGAWGYSMPAFPSHTPSNFATLMTGAFPERHGIADGPMRVEGRPLSAPSVNGFSSASKRVEPVWRTLEAAGLRVALVSVPGSTPPELDAGATLRGRWGGWGEDLPALSFESGPEPGSGGPRGLATRLFYQGAQLTLTAPARPASGWAASFPSKGRGREMRLPAYGATVHALIAEDGGAPSVSLSLDKRVELARLRRPDDWSDWTPIVLRPGGRELPTRFRGVLIRLSPELVKLRLVFDALHRGVVQPPELAEALGEALGPMSDFPDNWPAQLNRLPEERAVMLSETRQCLDWHRRAAGRLLSVEKPDVLIQDTYAPNQMLESRWWLRHVDPGAEGYDATPPEERASRLAELQEMYQGIDAVLGEAMRAAGPETVFVLSSDHGILPMRREVLVNNLLAREGLLSFAVDAETGEPRVDWKKSRAVFLKMIGVYANPAGLAGPWKRASGPEYEALRERVSALLSGLSHEGRPVVERVLGWEKAGELRLPEDRVPDLVLAMTPGYALTEDMDESGELLRVPLQSGYKQAVRPESEPRLWTPFVLMGPGVRKGVRLQGPISNADQAPTLLTLLGIPPPEHVQGRVLAEVLERR